MTLDEQITRPVELVIYRADEQIAVVEDSESHYWLVHRDDSQTPTTTRMESLDEALREAVALGRRSQGDEPSTRWRAENGRPAEQLFESWIQG